MNKKPPINLQPEDNATYEELIKRETVVICGRNNSGKSFLLRHLHNTLGDKTSYLGSNRYNNFTSLGVISGERNKSEEWRNLIRQWQKSSQNIDNSPLNLQRAIGELGNEKRNILFEIISNLLGSEIEVKYSNPENDMSQKYVSVDGYNISYTSSGFRLITSIIASLLDDYYENVLIDEPELGISPEIQGLLADFLFDSELRKKFFPHIKKVVMATHSPVFLSRQDIRNNFYVEKVGTNITISQLKKHQDINSLQFFLLGNRFETLYLPSIVVLVEGKCDYNYLDPLLKKKFPESHISIIHCNTDNRIKEYVFMINNMLGDVKKSPYQNRIIAVLDSVHQSGLKEALIKLGLSTENVIIWDENGIEYYYPKNILTKIFGEFDELKINDDIVSANGIDYSKGELVNMVSDKLDGKEELNQEFNDKLISKLEELIY